MKIRHIFDSSFAVELAKDLAERLETLPPHKIIRKLVRFAIIGAIAFAVVIAMIFMIRSTPGDDANTRQVLVFASFASALVLVSSIGAILVTLWDGFVGQYIQRLALMDVEQDASDSQVVYEIPVVDMPEPAIAAEAVEHMGNVVVSVEDEEFVHNGDLSIAMVGHRLEGLKTVLSEDEWTRFEFQKHVDYFEGLGRNVTVGRNLSAMGKGVLASAMPMISSPGLVARYEMTAKVADMLVDLEESITPDEEDDIANQANQAAAS